MSELDISVDAITVRIAKSIESHVAYRKKEDKEVCVRRLSKEIVDTLGNVSKSLRETERNNMGFKLVVDRDNEQFSCSQGGNHAGYMAFSQLTDMMVAKLRTLPDGFVMGELDLNLMSPENTNVDVANAELSSTPHTAATPAIPLTRREKRALEEQG